jgi:hypothetical protein
MRTLRQRLRRRLKEDAGLITAEYAIVCLAAVAFGGVLLRVLTSETVQTALASVVRRALG